MAIIFIYKKGDDLVFCDEYDARKDQDKLFEDGYKHIATVDAATVLDTIYKITISRNGVTDKVLSIRKFFKFN
jgi:hypothetical protein